MGSETLSNQSHHLKLLHVSSLYHPDKWWFFLPGSYFSWLWICNTVQHNLFHMDLMGSYIAILSSLKTGWDTNVIKEKRVCLSMCKVSFSSRVQVKSFHRTILTFATLIAKTWLHICVQWECIFLMLPLWCLIRESILSNQKNLRGSYWN